MVVLLFKFPLNPATQRHAFRWLLRKQPLLTKSRDRMHLSDWSRRARNQLPEDALNRRGLVLADLRISSRLITGKAWSDSYSIHVGNGIQVFKLNMEGSETVADALNAINRANLRGVAGTETWRELVEDYFVLREDDEPEEIIEDGPSDIVEPPDILPEEEEEDEDRDEDLLSIDPMVEIADEEQKRCRNFW